MRTPLVLIAAALVAATPLAHAGEAPPAKDRLEKLRALAGTWKGKAHDQEVTVTWKVTGGGSAVVETIGPGTPHEMVTVYHLDGEDLLLTHYCAAGNQPTLRAVAGDDKGLSFDFVRGTNMKPADMHMHALRITFLGPDALRSEWTSWKDGKPGGSVQFEVARQK